MLLAHLQLTTSIIEKIVVAILEENPHQKNCCCTKVYCRIQMAAPIRNIKLVLPAIHCDTHILPRISINIDRQSLVKTNS